jgi:uncharacterized membrane protein YqiK
MAVEDIFGWLYVIPILVGLVVLLALAYSVGRMTFVFIEPDQIGLVTKNFSAKKLGEGEALAFNGEAGYQAKTLKPGMNFVLPFLYTVKKFPMLQVPAGSYGLIWSQIGEDLPNGQLNATAEGLEMEDYMDPAKFIAKHGQKGLQRKVLQQSSTWTFNPVAFNVKTNDGVWGMPLSENMEESLKKKDTKITVIGGSSSAEPVIEGRR